MWRCRRNSRRPRSISLIGRGTRPGCVRGGSFLHPLEEPWSPKTQRCCRVRLETGQERDQTVDFSGFYYNSRQSLAVNTDETPDIASSDDIGDGDTVGVQRGTTGQAWAEENLETEGATLKTYKNAPDAFRDLEAGAVTAVVNDEPSSAEIIKDLAGVELVEAIDTNEKYAFAFAPDNPQLIQAVNGALDEIIADGTYAMIFQEYFPGVEVPAEFQASA